MNPESLSDHGATSLLEIPKQQAIYLAVKPVDMCKSCGGLTTMVHDILNLNPLEGQLFVFRNNSGDKIKLLMWDRNGFVQYYTYTNGSCPSAGLNDLQGKNSENTSELPFSLELSHTQSGRGF